MLGSDRDVPRSIIGFNPVACSWTCLVEVRVRGGLDVGSNKAVFGICFQSCYARRIRKTAETRRSCEPLQYSYVIFFPNNNNKLKIVQVDNAGHVSC